MVNTALADYICEYASGPSTNVVVSHCYYKVENWPFCGNEQTDRDSQLLLKRIHNIETFSSGSTAMEVLIHPSAAHAARPLK